MNGDKNISVIVNQACKKGCHSCSSGYEKEVSINWDLKLFPKLETYLPATNESLSIHASVQGEAVMGVFGRYDSSSPSVENFFFGKIYGNHLMKGIFTGANRISGVIIAKHEPFQADKSLTFKM